MKIKTKNTTCMKTKMKKVHDKMKTKIQKFMQHENKIKSANKSSCSMKVQKCQNNWQNFLSQEVRSQNF